MQDKDGNKVLSKTFETLEDGSKEISIKNGDKSTDIKLFYDNKTGKVNSIFKKGKHDFGSRIDLLDGKIQAKATGGQCTIEKAEIFDSNGKVAKTIKVSDYINNGTCVDIISSDEPEKIITAKCLNDNPIKTKVADLKFGEPKKILYTKDGTSLLIADNGSNKQYSFIQPDTRSIVLSVQPENTTLTKNGKAVQTVNFTEFGSNGECLNSALFVDGKPRKGEPYLVLNSKKAFIPQINNLLELLKKEKIQLDMPIEDIEKSIKKI